MTLVDSIVMEHKATEGQEELNFSKECIVIAGIL